MIPAKDKWERPQFPSPRITPLRSMDCGREAHPSPEEFGTREETSDALDPRDGQCLSRTQKQIIRELYLAFEGLGASSDLLSLIGSWGDTLPEEEILTMLQDYNRTGTIWKVVYPVDHERDR